MTYTLRFILTSPYRVIKKNDQYGIEIYTVLLYKDISDHEYEYLHDSDTVFICCSLQTDLKNIFRSCLKLTKYSIEDILKSKSSL